MMHLIVISRNNHLSESTFTNLIIGKLSASPSGVPRVVSGNYVSTTICHAIILNNFLAIGFKLNIPLVNALALSSPPHFTKVYIQRPLRVILILKVRPPQAVLRKGTLLQ